MHILLNIVMLLLMLITADFTFAPLKAALKLEMGIGGSFDTGVSLPIPPSEEKKIKSLAIGIYTFGLVSWGILMGLLTYFIAGTFSAKIPQLTILALAMVGGVGSAVKDVCDLKVLGRETRFPSKRVLAALPSGSKATYLLSLLLQFVSTYILLTNLVIKS